MSSGALHIATEIKNPYLLKILLQWRTPEKHELEAKNMNGETPLHIAAKNGCSESARVLLDHGASPEAKTNNGMTPLGMALFHSADSTIVNTLLHYNADHGVKDTKSANPLNCLSQNAGGEKVQKLFNRQEQRICKSSKAFMETKAKKESTTPQNRLSQGASGKKVQELLNRKEQKLFEAIKSFSEAKAKMESTTPQNRLSQGASGKKVQELVNRKEQRLYEAIKSFNEAKAKMESATSLKYLSNGTGGDKVQKLIGQKEQRKRKVIESCDEAKANMESAVSQNCLSQGAGGEKVQEHVDQEEQKKRKATESCREAEAKMEEFELAMSNIVGLEELKLQLHKWTKGMLVNAKRRAMGLEVAARKTPHLVFLGNPGTGKTMIARCLGKLLHNLGVLPTDKVTEVQRTDLVGEYIGHTGPKTRLKIKEAEGGILFIDEAYRLVPQQRSFRDFGLEALEEIMSVMDSGKVSIIFAGYCEPMKHVISSNDGLRRRVTKIFSFDDFSTTELAQILHLKMKDQDEKSSLYGFKLHPQCNIESVAELLERESTEKQRKEHNGGLIDQLLENARENLDLRHDFSSTDADGMITITMEDLVAGLRSLSQQELHVA